VKKQDVEHVRTFRETGRELGVALGPRTDCVEWFVFDRAVGDPEWSMHCGPYSDAAQARWWIEQIREGKAGLR
jgi:hypothetical protein